MFLACHITKGVDNEIRTILMYIETLLEALLNIQVYGESFNPVLSI